MEGRKINYKTLKLNTLSWVAAAVAVVGVGTSIYKGIKQKKANKKMEALANAQKPDQGITDYYKSALQRYNTNPYQSQFYQNAKQNADRNLATGINALQSRRSAVGGIAALTNQSNNAMRNAGVGAENMQNQAFGQLGRAAGVNSQEQKYPMEMKYNMYGAQAAGYGQASNAGLQSAYNGLGSVGSYLAANKGNRSSGNYSGMGTYGGNGGGGYYSDGQYIGE
jgi:hypothetical protein